MPELYYTLVQENHSNIVISYNLSSLILSTLLKALIINGLICFLSFLLLKKVDIHPLKINNFKNKILYSGFFIGLINGLFAVSIIFISNAKLLDAPLWVRILGLLCNLNLGLIRDIFSFTLIYFIIYKIARGFVSNRNYLIWTSMIIHSLIFVGSEIPSFPNFNNMQIPVKIYIYLALFGVNMMSSWIYFKKGIWTSLVSNTTAQIMITFKEFLLNF